MSWTMDILKLFLSLGVCLGNVLGSEHELLKRIEALEQRDIAQTPSMQMLEFQNHKYSNKLANLEEENKMLRKKLIDTNAQLQDNSELLESVRKEMGEIKQRADKQQDTINQLETEIKHLKQVEEIVKELDDLSQEKVHKKQDFPKLDVQDDTSIDVAELVKSTISLDTFRDVDKYTEIINWLAKSSKHKLGARSGNKISMVRQNRQINESVAFHAVLTPFSEQHVGISQNIRFDKTLLNLGNGFHEQHGLFIAPRSGLYLFSATVCTKDKHTYDQLVKNGQPLAGLASPDLPTENDEATQGSVTVLTQLNTGDEVWVVHKFPNDGFIWGNYATSFSGVLLIEA